MSSRPLTRVCDRGPHSTILLPSFTVQSPGYQLVTNCLPSLPGCDFLRGGIVTYFMVEIPTYSKKPAPTTVLVLVTESCPTLCDPMDCIRQAPQTIGFSRQEYWSGWCALLEGIFPSQGPNPRLFCPLHWQAIS